MNNKKITIKKTFELAFQNHQKKNFEVAKNLYKEILNIDPDHFGSNFLLGSLSMQIKNFNEAKQFLQKAIQIQPNHVDAHNVLGTVFKQLGELKKSISCYEKAIQINPNYAAAHNNLGIVFQELGESQKTISCFQKAIQLNPNDVSAHSNLGAIFKQLGELQKAKKSCQKAIAIQPNQAEPHNNLGTISKELGEHQEAISCYEKAIQINPNYAVAYNNLGNVFKELRKYKEAISCHKKAINIQPSFAQAHTNLAFLLLLSSDLQKGFDEYEWRKKIPWNKFYIENDIRSLEWKGEDLTNKTILIFSELGIGDIIQFARYLYMIQDKYSTTIIFRTRKKLMHLFSESKFKVISDDDPIPKHDFHKLLLSLPQIFYKETKKLPKQINYIFKNKKVFSKWKDKLSKIDGIKVGINWQGSKITDTVTWSGDQVRFKTIPLKFFEQLFTIEKINFISLQKGSSIEQIKDFKYKDKLYDFSAEVDNGKNAFEDTIGIVQNLDLVISLDTSLPHVSATLGVKTWWLLPFASDWRFFLKSTDSPWYENSKLYRQNEINKWDSVFNNIKKDLVNLVNE